MNHRPASNSRIIQEIYVTFISYSACFTFPSLQEYHIDITDIKGKNNAMMDVLSKVS